MENNQITITKQYDYKDKYLCIQFLGHSNNDLDIEQEEKKLGGILDNLFDTEVIFSFSEVIKKIKIIFRSFKEDELLVAMIHNNNLYKRTIRYLSNEIVLYHSKQPIIIDGKEKHYEFSFKKREGLKFSSPNENCKGLDETNYITKELQLLKKLQCMETKKLDDIDKIICTIYRLFYQKNPDFSIVEDRIRAISMLVFLINFNISLSSMSKDYSFNLTQNKKMITSLDLMLDLMKLAPFGEIPIEIGSVELSDYCKTRVEIVGREIREQMNKQPNPTQWFVDLVKINYIKKYYLFSKSSVEEIAEYGNCQQDTVMNDLKLVKTIDKKLKNQYNF